jgi:hypothetical protein
MPQGLRRFHNTGQRHFITCSCYRRQPFLGSARRRDYFLKVFEEVRQKYDFVVWGYVVMPEHFHILISEPAKGNVASVMRVLSFGFLNFLLAVLLFLPAMSLPAQKIEIKLVDGRNGHPMVGASSYVNVWVGGERKEGIAIPTDEKGVARLQLTMNPSEVNIPNSKNNGSIVIDHPVVKYDEFFRINAPYVLCGPRGGSYSWLELKNFSTKEVLDHGYASANTCGKVTVSPQPGQVVLFVRPLTFWEKMKQ